MAHKCEEFEFCFEARRNAVGEECVHVMARARACHPPWCWHPQINTTTGELSAEWWSLSHVPTGLAFAHRLTLPEIYETIREIHKHASEEEIMGWDGSTRCPNDGIRETFKRVRDLGWERESNESGGTPPRALN